MKESKLQDKCIDYLKSQGIYYINIFGSGRTAKGAPDLICCINGRFVAFELKVEDNEMQPDQVIHKRRIERNGGQHYCPRTLDEFITIVEGVSSYMGGLRVTKEKSNCPWCVSEYTIIDDDFGQPVSSGLINYCFYCGRKLRRVSNGTKG